MNKKKLFVSKKRIICIIAGLIFLIGAFWAFISASVITHQFKDKIENHTYKNKEANIKSLLVTETKDGEKHWELYAESGNYSDVDNVVLLEGIIGNLYEENKVKASFKANRGKYNSDSKEIELNDDIIMVYEDGTNIKAQTIEYKGKGQDIIAKGNVEIEKPDEAVIMGSKAVLSGNYKDFKIEGKTKTRFYM